ncbi:methyltransferase domain-containing protein [bacterium]|nr:methyltransferase domain-containing protein [bacterium]
MTQWNAEEYSRHSQAQMDWAAGLIGALNLRGDESILDIGCGDGKVTAQLARAVPDGSVVGLDSSEEMVRFAQAHFPPAQWPNLRFEPGDARWLGFDGVFDLVFSNATLHWVVDHGPVLAGIARALKPGGRAVLQMGGRGNAGEVMQAAERLIARPSWASFFGGFTFPYGFHEPVAYRQWLLAAGLTPVRVELIPKDMAKANADELAGWMRTTWMPYTHRVPEELREQFVAELVGEYLVAHPPAADGSIHVAMVRLEVEASRPA